MTDLVWLAAILLPVIIIHEWGHYYIAKRNGIIAEVFSIGFGPKLFGKKIGATTWQIALIPFGGYVSFPEKSMESLSPWQKIRISFAGPFINIVTGPLPLLLLALIFKPEVILPIMSELLNALWLTFAGTAQIFWSMITFDSTQVEGIRTVVGMGHEAVKGSDMSLTSIPYPVSFFALSWSIAFINLVPVKPLDGGHIIANLYAMYIKPVKYLGTAVKVPYVAINLIVVGWLVYVLGRDTLRAIYDGISSLLG